MNTAQQYVVSLAMLVGIGMGLFPPWRYQNRLNGHAVSDHSERPAGYAPIWDPPKPEPTAVAHLLPKESQLLGAGVVLDHVRLGVQFVVLFIAAGSLVLLFKQGAPRRRPLPATAPVKMVAPRSGWPLALTVLVTLAYAGLMTALVPYEMPQTSLPPVLVRFGLEAFACYFMSGSIAVIVLLLSDRSRRAATIAFVVVAGLAALGRISQTGITFGAR